MKTVATIFVSFFVGVLAAIGAFTYAANVSDFQISLTANGEIEMECSEGCAWEKLTWICNKEDPNKQCTVAFDEFGVEGPD